MNNLISKHGADWFMNKFRGSVFMYEDDVCTPVSLHRTYVSSRRIRLDASATTETPEAVQDSVQVPHEFFDTVAKFAVPQLGWRALDKGRCLYYTSRNNSSYHRGLSLGNLITNPSGLTRYLQRAGRYRYTPCELTKLASVAKPTFLTLPEGLALMREGAILSFAVSPVIAVVPGETGPRLMFKNKVAGTIADDGSIEFLIPSLKSYMENSNEVGR